MYIHLPATDDFTVPTLLKKDARHPSSMLSERHHSAETYKDVTLKSIVLYLKKRPVTGDRSFQVAAPALWNILPGETRSITDLGIFKRHLKTHLFSEAFY